MVGTEVVVMNVSKIMFFDVRIVLFAEVRGISQLSVQPVMKMEMVRETVRVAGYGSISSRK